ncbi:MAG: hypothetical protein Q7S22_04955 [Candidatus Micrarchaeota archaeon]|nr:hypothetical protein [Candidatus Micrarchaeota archaeon]
MFTLNNFLKIRQYLLLSFILVNLISITFANHTVGHNSGGGTGGLVNIQRAMGTLCVSAQGLIVLVTILLAVLSAIVYSLGQVLGAETRARATVWATAMFTGALIGILIYIVVPVVIALMLTGNSDTSWVRECCRAEPTLKCTTLGK